MYISNKRIKKKHNVKTYFITQYQNSCTALKFWITTRFSLWTFCCTFITKCTFIRLNKQLILNFQSILDFFKLTFWEKLSDGALSQMEFKFYIFCLRRSYTLYILYSTYNITDVTFCTWYFSFATTDNGSHHHVHIRRMFHLRCIYMVSRLLFESEKWDFHDHIVLFFLSRKVDKAK